MDTNMDTKEVGSSLICGLPCLSKGRPDSSEEERLAVAVHHRYFWVKKTHGIGDRVGWEPCGSLPLTPPYVRFRIRRFMKDAQSVDVQQAGS
jgi:hypothetical protein